MESDLEEGRCFHMGKGWIRGGNNREGKKKMKNRREKGVTGGETETERWQSNEIDGRVATIGKGAD